MFWLAVLAPNNSSLFKFPGLRSGGRTKSNFQDVPTVPFEGSFQGDVKVGIRAFYLIEHRKYVQEHGITRTFNTFKYLNTTTA